MGILLHSGHVLWVFFYNVLVLLRKCCCHPTVKPANKSIPLYLLLTDLYSCVGKIILWIREWVLNELLGFLILHVQFRSYQIKFQWFELANYLNKLIWILVQLDPKFATILDRFCPIFYLSISFFLKNLFLWLEPVLGKNESKFFIWSKILTNFVTVLNWSEKFGLNQTSIKSVWKCTNSGTDSVWNEWVQNS